MSSPAAPGEMPESVALIRYDVGRTHVYSGVEADRGHIEVGTTRYVRADLYDRAIREREALQAELDEARAHIVALLGDCKGPRPCRYPEHEGARAFLARKEDHRDEKA